MVTDFLNYVIVLVLLVIAIWIIKKVTSCLFRLAIAMIALGLIYYLFL